MEPLQHMRSTLLVLFLLAATSTANAQDSVRRVEGGPITVTGVATPVDSLPISSSFRVMTPTQSMSSNSLEQVIRAVPGVQIDNRNNYALGDRITMRGIGARSFFGTRGIRVMKDDIPLTFADGQTNLEILDPTQLANVRALHGPVASIFGNASGGALLFRSLQPPTPGTIARGAATFGSFGYQRFTGSLGSLDDKLSYGAYITLDSMKGYREWSGMNAAHLGAQVAYTFEDDVVRFMFDNVAFSAQNPGALSQRLLDSNRRMAYANNTRQKAGKDGHQTQAGLTWLHDLGASSLTSSAYAITRNVTNPTPQQIVSLDRKLFGLGSVWEKPPDQTMTDESFTEKLSFAAMLDLQYQTDGRLEHVNNNGSTDALQTEQDENILNLGIGAHASYPLLSTLSVTAGARYDMITFKAEDKLINETNPDESGEVTMSAISPSIGLLYTGFQDHHFFINASQSFETPTSTELANKPDGSGGYNNDLDPQRTTSFEAGWRGRVTDVFRYSIALFAARITDALIPFQVPGQEGRDFYRNAGEITNEGAEFEIIAEPIDGMRATLGYTYVDSRFTDYITPSDTLNGNRQPGVHPHLGSLDVIYRMPFGLYLNGTMRIAGKVAVNDANTAYSPEYTIVDLKAGYEIAIEDIGRYTMRIEPYIHVNNLFDRKYIGSFAINAFGGRYYEPSPERSIFAGVQVML
jgi:iron complex outermembrane receptor protein